MGCQMAAHPQVLLENSYTKTEEPTKTASMDFTSITNASLTEFYKESAAARVAAESCVNTVSIPAVQRW